MTVPSGHGGLIENLTGALDVMLGRADGMRRLDLSTSGILWSFSALAMAGLIDISALSMLHNNIASQAQPMISKTYYISGHLVVAVIGYAASMVALFLLCRTPLERQKFPAAVAVHNWAAPTVSLAFLPLLALAHYLDDNDMPERSNSALDLISVMWIAVLVFVGVRLLRISLELPVNKAIAFFVATAAVSLIITLGLESMLGLGGRS